MHGRMHPKYGLVTSLLAYDPLSSLVYPMTAHTPMIASNLPTVKTSVARQWPTIISERISARHWITDCGSGIGSCMFVCLYVCPSRFWNAIKAQRMRERDGNSICTTNMHVFACVRLHACMCCNLSTWIIICPKWGDVYFLVSFSDNSGLCWKFLVGGSA